VQQIAAGMKLRLIAHPTYTDKRPGIVYKTDLDPGTPIRPNHYINVWYSKGPEYVSVPDVTHLDKDAAQQKLKEAGLILGKIDTRYDDKVPEDVVISQSVSHKKRVFHDTPVDLVTSLGPKPDYADSTADTGNTTNPTDQNPPAGADNTANPAIGNETGNGDNAAGNTAQNADPYADNGNGDDQHEFDRTISIPRDGQGVRRVRIEYTDAKSPSPILAIDEDHDAGDKIPVQFLYYGKKITLSIYFNDHLAWHRTFDPLATRHQRIQ